MFKRSFFLSSNIIAVFVIASFSACSSPPSLQNTKTFETNVSVNFMPSESEEFVIERLVSEALNIGNLDLLPDHSLSQQTLLTTEPATLVTEPVTPTVTMTANKIVEHEINDYLQNRRRMLRLWMERGATYFPMIEQIFAEEGIPDELKYVALGESNLQARAQSPVGAAGIWQFMPATGSASGLQIDAWVDERLDPEKATRAAAVHFKELYETYNGNWHLVLAGYNCSFRCISRAVSRAGGSIDNPPSYWEIYPYLPEETRGFIPKFIAASLIISNPGLYGIKTEKSSPDFSYDIVEVSGRLSLEDAAILANSDLKTLSSLNPSLLRNSLPASPSNAAYALKIPLHSYDNFVRAFPNLAANKKVPLTEYEITSGDNLGKIALLFGISVAELQSTNNISGYLIHPGQKLTIPSPVESSEANKLTSISSTMRTFVDYNNANYRPIKLGEGFELVEQPDSTPENQLMMVSLLNRDEDYSFLDSTIYTVRSGDTLGHISSRFDVSINDIKLWNEVRGTTIFPNQELILHTLSSTQAISSYQVRTGDNLGAIANRFGVSVSNLKRWNGLINNLIFPGQNLELN